MAISPNTNFSAGQILTATQANQWPRGIMALATRNTNFAPDTTISDFASVTFTAEANRYYKYSLFIPGADSSAALLIIILLTNAANADVNSFTQSLRGPGLLDTFTCVTVRTETAGSITRKIRMETTTGNASMCSAGSIGYFLVEDIGPA